MFVLTKGILPFPIDSNRFEKKRKKEKKDENSPSTVTKTKVFA